MLTQGEDILVFQLGGSLGIHLHWFDQLVLPGQNLQPMRERFLGYTLNENYKLFTKVLVHLSRRYLSSHGFIQ